MRWIRISLIVLAFLWSAKLTNSVAVVQAGNEEKARQCVTLIKEQTAALVARDWSQLERLAKQYLQDCKEVHDSEAYSGGYEHLAIANMYLGNEVAALAMSEKCINIFYGNSGCHVEKVQALIKLKRISEARDALEIAERLVAHLIDNNERHLHETHHPIYKELYSAKLYQLRAEKSLLEQIRRLVYR